MKKEYVGSGSTLDAAIDAACLLADVTPDMAEIEVLDLGGKGIFGFGRKDARVKVTIEIPDEPAPKPASSTFGTKKSKKERFEEKNAKKQQVEVELRPIITADSELADSPLPERKPRPERQEQRPRNDRNDRGPKSKPDQRPQGEEERKPRKESHATMVSEGEMAENLYAAAIAFLSPIFAKLQVEPELSYSVKEGALWINCAGQNLGLLIGHRGDTLNALQYLTNLVVNKRRHDHVRMVLNVEGYRETREETLAALAHRMADKAVKSGRRVELEPMNPHERRVVHIALQNDKRVDTVSHGEEPYRRIVISKKRAPGEKGGSSNGYNKQRRRRPPRPQGVPGGAEHVAEQHSEE